jgi:hypothetical protein
MSSQLNIKDLGETSHALEIKINRHGVSRSITKGIHANIFVGYRN